MDGGSIPPISTTGYDWRFGIEPVGEVRSAILHSGVRFPHLHKNRMQGVRVLVTRLRVTARG